MLWGKPWADSRNDAGLVMRQLAEVQLELLTQSLWWAAVVGAAGLAMIFYAWMLRRENREQADVRSAGAAAKRSAMTLAGVPLGIVAAVIGAICLGMIVPILYLPERIA